MKDNRTKVILTQKRAPGDTLMLTAAVRDLKLTYPDRYAVDVKTAVPEVWLNNPYIEGVNKTKKDVIHIEAEYKDLLKEMTKDYSLCTHHFVFIFHTLLEQTLNIRIKRTAILGDIHFSKKELQEKPPLDGKYWIINAGGKRDFTNKIWEHRRFQQIVDAFPDITFVQTGRSHHLHTPLSGRNVVNLIDKTSIREFMQFVRFSGGVITAVSFPMHLAAAMSAEHIKVPDGLRRFKPCIVLAGGRENSNWEAYPWHYFIHRNNMLFCCENSGCWKRRVERLEDGERFDDSLCRCPVKTPSGQYIPKCMDMITADEVIDAVKHYERKN